MPGDATSARVVLFTKVMKMIPMALIALTLSGGVALADRDRGRGRDVSHRSGGVHVTPSRGHDHTRYDNNRRYDNRRYDNRRYDRTVRVQRVRPTFRNNRFYFAGGNYQTYQRPVIQYHYRNYSQRPALLVENTQPVSGYVWNSGHWEWDDYEWQWIAGHYDVDTAYQDSSYGYQEPYNSDQGSDYDSSNYDYEPSYNTYQSPSVNGGIQVQGSWNF